MKIRNLGWQKRIGLRTAPAFLHALVQRMRKTLMIIMPVNQQKRGMPKLDRFWPAIRPWQGAAWESEHGKADKHERKLAQICRQSFGSIPVFLPVFYDRLILGGCADAIAEHISKLETMPDRR